MVCRILETQMCPISKWRCIFMFTEWSCNVWSCYYIESIQDQELQCKTRKVRPRFFHSFCNIACHTQRQWSVEALLNQLPVIGITEGHYKSAMADSGVITHFWLVNSETVKQLTVKSSNSFKLILVRKWAGKFFKLAIKRLRTKKSCFNCVVSKCL